MREPHLSIPDKALWVIERNSAQPLTVDAIAAACGVSRSHLAHAFGTATGQSVMHYLRGRRLSDAARALADGAPDILALALDAGYGSHEAFTRAFRDRFDLTPEAVRDRGSVVGVPLVDPLELRARATVHLDPPRFASAPLMRVIGLNERCSFDTNLTIPAQWQRFMATLYETIPDKAEAMPVGIIHAAADDGRFDYLCAAEVRRFGTVPSGLQRLEIPARSYAVFEHRGHVAAISETYFHIWNVAMPSLGRAVADAPVIEHHNPAFDPDTGEGGLSLWIPLAD